MTTHNKRHGAQQQPRQNSRPINIDEWKSRPGAANHQSTGAINTPAILAQLTRREKQAVVLRGIFSEHTTDDQLDALVGVLVTSQSEIGDLKRVGLRSDLPIKGGGPHDLD